MINAIIDRFIYSSKAFNVVSQFPPFLFRQTRCDFTIFLKLKNSNMETTANKKTRAGKRSSNVQSFLLQLPCSYLQMLHCGFLPHFCSNLLAGTLQHGKPGAGGERVSRDGSPAPARVLVTVGSPAFLPGSSPSQP